MHLSPGGPSGAEQRGAPRYRVYATLRVIWPDVLRGCNARLLDISDSGAAVEAAEPLAFGTLVYIELRRFGLSGAAHVRRCGVLPSGYFAALEFAAPLQVNAAPGARA